MEIWSLAFCVPETVWSGLHSCPVQHARLEEYVPKRGMLTPFRTENTFHLLAGPWKRELVNWICSLGSMLNAKTSVFIRSCVMLATYGLLHVKTHISKYLLGQAWCLQDAGLAEWRPTLSLLSEMRDWMPENTELVKCAYQPIGFVAGPVRCSEGRASWKVRTAKVRKPKLWLNASTLQSS